MLVMLPSHKVRILVATQPLDFRKGHDGLAALVQSMLKENPFTGTVFVFRDEPFERHWCKHNGECGPTG